MNKTAEILCVGTELLLGNTINTNAAYLGRKLSSIGIFVYYSTVIGDNVERLKSALSLALSRSDIVITTGGLGPTYDDLTKETVAEYFGLKMEMHQHSLERIRSYFNKLQRHITPNNEKQAMMPTGAVVFDNDYGTAPALAVANADKSKMVILLPGPPREMQPMYEEKVKPFLLHQFTANTLVSKMLNIFGMGESAVESKLIEIMRNSTNPTVAPYAKFGEVELRITASGKNESECMKLIEPTIEKIYSILGDVIYGIDAISLQNKLVEVLHKQNLTIATAESCTGGYISKRITDISGSSDVFVGGVTTYSNASKVAILNVSEKTLATYGAVSGQTACEMAKNVAKLFHSDIGVSSTGIAGPTGGSAEKPVGLVYIGYYYNGNNYAIKLNIGRGSSDDRESIRYIAASYALNEVLKQFDLDK
ncbi:MAG: competence/damage-inducible protein A [Ignavibacteria bacterium]|nr:competence/damage-inducible protein A [Ignavibacteria bacterium]